MVGIIRNRCIGCGVCASICPDGFEMVNGKARIKDANADCLKDAAEKCPQNCIVLGDGKESESEDADLRQDVNRDNSSFAKSGWFGRGRGIGAGMGRGLGVGPRDGRGRGRGGGRRRW